MRLVSVCSDNSSEQDQDQVALVAIRALVDSRKDRVVTSDQRLHGMMGNALAACESSSDVVYYCISLGQLSHRTVPSPPDPIKCRTSPSNISLTLTVRHWIVLVHWTS